MSKSKNANPTKDPLEINDVVIFIDNNNDSCFDLVSHDSPHCLLPLANVPVLFYTMLQLIKSKFRNFKIFSGAHHRKIVEFFRQVNFEKFIGEKCKIDVIGDKSIRSCCDAIRYLDNEKFDRGFVMIHGDLVTSLDFGKLAREFQATMKRDPSMILARVVTTTVPEGLTRPTDRVRHDASTILEGLKKSPHHDPDVFLCSHKVPSRVAEHYDLESMADLVETVHSHADVVPDRVALVVTDAVCFRVTSVGAYWAVGRELVRLRVPGLGPRDVWGDLLHVRASAPILLNTTAVYLHAGVAADLAGFASRRPGAVTRLIGTVMIMDRVTVGSNCRLDNCIVGYECQIGDNVTLRNCVLMDRVVVGGNCTVTDSLLCAGCRVGRNSVISDKSIVDHNFQVEPETKCSQSILSDRHVDYFWDNPIVNEDYAINEIEDSKKDENKDDSAINEEDESVLFGREFEVLMEDAISDQISIENIIVESDRLKHQYALDVEDTCAQIALRLVHFYLNRPCPTCPVCDTAISPGSCRTHYRSNFVSLLSLFGPVLGKYAGKDVGRINCFLEAVEEAACDSQLVMDRALDIFYSFYNEDIVSEDDIMRWYEESGLLNDPEYDTQTRLIRQKLQPFITHLQEAEEESDSD